MCTNKSWITNKRGRRILVKCGRCPACLQEKAIARTNRIRAAIPEDGSMTFLFVTLTYSNLFVPYFDFDEFKQSPLIHSSHANPDFPDGVQAYKRLNIYRNGSIRWIRSDKDYNSTYKIVRERQLLDTYLVPSEFFHKGHVCDFFGDDYHYQFDMKCPPRIRHNGRQLKRNIVSVSYYPDIQNFFKRLRINLQRKYNYDDPFTFYSCSEYGETYARAHFHLLIGFKRRNSFSQSEDFMLWKSAIISSWPFASRDVMQKSVEIARNAASYVASYVNCITSLHPFLREFAPLRPKHSYSHGFGQALRNLQYEKIIEAYERGDLRVDLPRIRNKCLVVERVLLPKYVISRAFPKFKGYCNLTSDEIVALCFRPEYIRNFSQFNDYTPEDCHRIEVTIRNKRAMAHRHGFDTLTFAHVYSRIWTIYASNVLRDSFEPIVSPKDYIYHYDNLADYLNYQVRSVSLDEAFELYSDRISTLPSDPNFYPSNVQKTLNLSKWFYQYRKDRRVRNRAILSSTKNFNI